MNPLNDFPPWIASEYKATARELQIADLWADKERFLEAFSCCSGLDPVLLNLFAAMKPGASVAVQRFALELAREKLELFVTECIDDEYLRMAINGVAA